MYYYGSFWSKCNPPVCAFCECLKVALLKHEFKPSKVVFSHNHDCSKENKLCQERDRIRSEDCGFGFWSWDSGQALGWKGISMNPWISIPKKLQKSEAFVRTFSWQLPERFMEFGIRSVLRMSLFKVCNIIQEWHHRFIYIVETEKKCHKWLTSLGLMIKISCSISSSGKAVRLFLTWLLIRAMRPWNVESWIWLPAAYLPPKVDRTNRIGRLGNCHKNGCVRVLVWIYIYNILVQRHSVV